MEQDDFKIHEKYVKHAIQLAKKAEGLTSPNPIVGAVLVKNGAIIGAGYHHKSGLPHAEIEAIKDAYRKDNGDKIKDSTLYVTLEPCSTYGKTPPCTEAIIREKIKKVVYGATDPNPAHSGKAKKILNAAGVVVIDGILSKECENLNPGFNYWIRNKKPFVILKSAMTLDGKIATETGESKWITGERTRRFAMNLRKISDAILVGVNTIIADNPHLTYRGNSRIESKKQLKRIILDPNGRIPLDANVITDEQAPLTIIVVSANAPQEKVEHLRKRVNVLVCPSSDNKINLNWLLETLGSEKILTLLVEGGGTTNSAFLESKLVNRVAFFYAPRIVCGINSIKAVGGMGFNSWKEIPKLNTIKIRRIDDDLMLDALVNYD